MAYLATLALAGVVAVDAAARRWEEGRVDQLTVQYRPLDAQSEEEEVDRLLALLRETPGVAGAEPLSRRALVDLLEPWLGEAAFFEDLPLPRLIDVSVAAGKEVDIEALSERLAAELPGASLDDPKRWLARLAELARSLQAVAAAIVLLVLAAAVGTVVVTTQMGLAAHRDAIEVLHLIGARDSYIARQFQRQALALGVRGGAMGLAVALVTIFGVREAASELEAPLIPALAFDAWGWGLIGVLPFVIALATMATARLTVLRSLARML